MYEGSSMLPTPETEVRPESFYAVSKFSTMYFAEAYAKFYGMKNTALRYFCVYGPRQDYRRTIPPLFSAFIIKLLRGQQPTIFGTGEKRRDFIHVDDINDFHLQCMTMIGRTERFLISVPAPITQSMRFMRLYRRVFLGPHVDPLHKPDLPGEAFANLADIDSARSLDGVQSESGKRYTNFNSFFAHRNRKRKCCVMKAVILAAGKGERLRAITENIPKPMIQFRGKPILEHNIELCRRFGVTQTLYQYAPFARSYPSLFWRRVSVGVRIEYTFEPELLGTSSAVRNFQSFLSDGPFFVLYGDNYSDYDLSALQKKQQEHSALGVIAFHWRDDTSSSGVAEFDEKGRISGLWKNRRPGKVTAIGSTQASIIFEKTFFRTSPTDILISGKIFFRPCSRRRYPFSESVHAPM